MFTKVHCNIYDGRLGMFKIEAIRRGGSGLPLKLHMFTTVNRAAYGGNCVLYLSVCSCFALVGCVCKLDCGVVDNVAGTCL